MGKPWFAVVTAHYTGIFSTWPGKNKAGNAITGFSRPLYKPCKTREEAETFWTENTNRPIPRTDVIDEDFRDTGLNERRRRLGRSRSGSAETKHQHRRSEDRGQERHRDERRRTRSRSRSPSTPPDKVTRPSARELPKHKHTERRQEKRGEAEERVSTKTTGRRTRGTTQQDKRRHSSAASKEEASAEETAEAHRLRYNDLLLAPARKATEKLAWTEAPSPVGLDARGYPKDAVPLFGTAEWRSPSNRHNWYRCTLTGKRCPQELEPSHAKEAGERYDRETELRDCEIQNAELKRQISMLKNDLVHKDGLLDAHSRQTRTFTEFKKLVGTPIELERNKASALANFDHVLGVLATQKVTGSNELSRSQYDSIARSTKIITEVQARIKGARNKDDVLAAYNSHLLRSSSEEDRKFSSHLGDNVASCTHSEEIKDQLIAARKETEDQAHHLRKKHTALKLSEQDVVSRQAEIERLQTETTRRTANHERLVASYTELYSHAQKAKAVIPQLQQQRDRALKQHEQGLTVISQLQEKLDNHITAERLLRSELDTHTAERGTARTDLARLQEKLQQHTAASTSERDAAKLDLARVAEKAETIAKKAGKEIARAASLIESISSTANALAEEDVSEIWDAGDYSDEFQFEDGHLVTDEKELARRKRDHYRSLDISDATLLLAHPALHVQTGSPADDTPIARRHEQQRRLKSSNIGLEALATLPLASDTTFPLAHLLKPSNSASKALATLPLASPRPRDEASPDFQPPPTWGKPDPPPRKPDLDEWGTLRHDPRGANDANRPHLHVSPGWEGFNPNQQLPPTTGAPPTTAQSNAQPARTAAPSPKTSKEQRVRDAWLEGYETVALQIEREHQEQARRQQDKDEFSERAARQWAKATGSPRPSPPTSAKKRKQNPPVGSPESATPDSADRSPPPNKRKTHGSAGKPVDLTKTKKTPTRKAAKPKAKSESQARKSRRGTLTRQATVPKPDLPSIWDDDTPCPQCPRGSGKLTGHRGRHLTERHN